MSQNGRSLGFLSHDLDNRVDTLEEWRGTVDKKLDRIVDSLGTSPSLAEGKPGSGVLGVLHELAANRRDREKRKGWLVSTGKTIAAVASGGVAAIGAVKGFGWF